MNTFEHLQSPFQRGGQHVPEELLIDLGHLASLESNAIPGYLARLADREAYPETYERYMGAIVEEALVFDALWTERNIDAMTGLFNKSSWERQLTSLVADAEKDDQNLCEMGDLAVFVIDLDQFKRLNDKLGHAIGDEAIERVGRRIHASLRSGRGKKGDTAGHQAEGSKQPQVDQTASHWGGDEFAVTAYFQPAGEDPHPKGRRKGRMNSKTRAEVIATRLEAEITDVATEMRTELLADPQYADIVAQMDTLFGVTIGRAVRKRGRAGKPGQTAKQFFKAADKDLENRKVEKKNALDKRRDPELARKLQEAMALLREHGEIR